MKVSKCKQIYVGWDLKKRLFFQIWGMKKAHSYQIKVAWQLKLRFQMSSDPNAHTQWYLVYITWKILFQFTHHSSFVRYKRKLNQFNDIRTTITNSRLYVFIFVIKRKILGIAIKNGK